MDKNKALIWLVSFGISAVALFFTVAKVYEVNRQYKFDESQVTNLADVKTYLEKNRIKYLNPADEPPLYVPTGLFIESMKFLNPNTVYVSGYVWQKYDATNRQITDRGVVFPEGTKIKIDEAYRRTEGSQEVIGWYFESELIQDFEYETFPLDHKVVWVRMWHREFDRNIILTPDFAAYDSTRKEDQFGLDKDIVLFGYELKETFFNYKESHYDTNFGMKNYVGQKDFPELYYNVVLMRDIANSLVVYFLPLFAVFVLLVFTVQMITSDEKKISGYGFNLSNMMRIAALLLFIVILSHIQLRNQVTASTIIYIEYAYFVAYIGIMLMVLASFTMGKRWGARYVPAMFWNDGILIKAAFLPFIALFLLIATYIKL